MDAPQIRYCRTDDDVSIAYWTLGQGPTVISMDSSAINHLALEWDVPGLRRYYLGLAESFQVVRYSQRGGALSGGGEETLDGYAADLVAVVDAIGRDRVALLPSAQGVGYALPFARRFPERVTCIVALAPLYHLEKALTHFRIWAATEEAMPERGPEVLARTIDLAGVDLEPLARLIDESWKAQPRSVEGKTRAFDLVADEAANVQTPILVVHWPEREWSEGAELAAQAPDTRLVVRSGGDGNHPWYDPDPDMALIRTFVLEHADQPSATPNTGPGRLEEDGPLTAREREVLRLVVDGRSSNEIAEDLTISYHTVTRHLNNIYGKLNVSGRAEAAAWAVRHGVVEE